MMTNKSILDNWEERFERMINKREEDMKNSKLDVTMGELIDFISSLLQAQRERDTKIIEKVTYNGEINTCGDTCTFDVCTEAKRLILNQNNNESKL